MTIIILFFYIKIIVSNYMITLIKIILNLLCVAYQSPFAILGGPFNSSSSTNSLAELWSADSSVM